MIACSKLHSRLKIAKMRPSKAAKDSLGLKVLHLFAFSFGHFDLFVAASSGHLFG